MSILKNIFGSKGSERLSPESSKIAPLICAIHGIRAYLSKAGGLTFMDLSDANDMMRDIACGKYAPPVSLVAKIYACAAYIVSPVDLIPEFIFGIVGYIDDTFVFRVLLTTMSELLADYRKYLDDQL